MNCQQIAGYSARVFVYSFWQHHWSKNCHTYQRHCSHILASLLTDFCDKFCEKLSRNFLGFCMRTLCAVNAKSVKKYSCKCSACRDTFQLYFYHNFEQIFPIFLLKMRTLCAVNFKQKMGFYCRLFPVKTCSDFEQDFIKKMMAFCAKNLSGIYVNLCVKLLPFFSVFFLYFCLKCGRYAP